MHAEKAKECFLLTPLLSPEGLAPVNQAGVEKRSLAHARLAVLFTSFDELSFDGCASSSHRRRE